MPMTRGTRPVGWEEVYHRRVVDTLVDRIMREDRVVYVPDQRQVELIRNAYNSLCSIIWSP